MAAADDQMLELIAAIGEQVLPLLEPYPHTIQGAVLAILLVAWLSREDEGDREAVLEWHIDKVRKFFPEVSDALLEDRCQAAPTAH